MGLKGHAIRDRKQETTNRTKLSGSVHTTRCNWRKSSQYSTFQSSALSGPSVLGQHLSYPSGPVCANPSGLSQQPLPASLLLASCANYHYLDLVCVTLSRLALPLARTNKQSDPTSVVQSIDQQNSGLAPAPASTCQRNSRGSLGSWQEIFQVYFQLEHEVNYNQKSENISLGIRNIVELGKQEGVDTSINKGAWGRL